LRLLLVTAVISWSSEMGVVSREGGREGWKEGRREGGRIGRREGGRGVILRPTALAAASGHSGRFLVVGDGGGE